MQLADAVDFATMAERGVAEVSVKGNDHEEPHSEDGNGEDGEEEVKDEEVEATTVAKKRPAAETMKRPAATTAKRMLKRPADSQDVVDPVAEPEPVPVSSKRDVIKSRKFETLWKANTLPQWIQDARNELEKQKNKPGSSYRDNLTTLVNATFTRGPHGKWIIDENSPELMEVRQRTRVQESGTHRKGIATHMYVSCFNKFYVGFNQGYPLDVRRSQDIFGRTASART